MTTENSENCLPPGWTVKVKVRKSGKRDKYYIEPSSQLRFNSRAEVSRYLKTAENSHSKSEENLASMQPGNNVDSEKAMAEGLPPGWIKEIRVTRTANRVRKDSYYVDPINGNVLRSMKDVHRYLTTGKVRRFAFKPRKDTNIEVASEHDAISSPAVSKKEMLATGKARRQIIWGQNSSEPSEITNNETMCKQAMRVGESLSASEPNSGHGGVGTELHCSNLLEARDSEQLDGKNSTPEKPVSHKCTVEKGHTKNECKRRQRKNKDTDIPLRASRRLAGLQADPTLEIKTNRRARPVTCKESDKLEASRVEQASHRPKKLEVKHETKSTIVPLEIIDISPVSDRKKHFCADSSILQRDVKKVKSEDTRDEQPKWSSGLPLEKHEGKVENEDKTDVKQGPSLKLPMEELFTDPCIAFAIKTLTGGVLDSSMNSEASPEPNDTEHPSAAFTSRNEKRILEPEYKLDEKQGYSSILPSADLGVGGIGKVENENVVEKLETTLELPVEELLADPCLEFAIKTLTGEIPLDIEDYFQQHSKTT